MKIKLLLILLLTTVYSKLSAQQKIITGVVVSAEDKSPLPGVSVKIKGLDGSTVTDKDGAFKISTKNGRFIEVSYIGYKTATIEIGSFPKLNVSLELADNTLSELQIVGSRNANRTKLNSPVPVDVIDLKTLQQNSPQASVTQLLQYVSPSFHSSVSGGGDAASATSTVQLKGLGVDQVLVLVNGKRDIKVRTSVGVVWEMVLPDTI